MTAARPLEASRGCAARLRAPAIGMRAALKAPATRMIRGLLMGREDGSITRSRSHPGTVWLIRR